jgi:DNA helicase HerA-like ATPase
MARSGGPEATRAPAPWPTFFGAARLLEDVTDAHVGVVFGNVSTTEFRFAVRDPSLRRLDYVQVEHPNDGVLVAHVTDITRETSLSFEDATRLGYGDAAAARRDHLVARARVIGFRDARGLLQAPRTPVPAGAEVRRVDEALLAHVFGLRDSTGAYLGVVKGYDLRVHLDINTLVQKHVSVLAKTGSGKSYAVGVLMEELIKTGVPIVVIDPHGEHASLAAPNTTPSDQAARRRFGVTPRNYAEHIVEYSPDTVSNPDCVPFRLEGVNLDARDIADLMGGKLTNSQMGILHAAIRDLKDREKDYSLEDVLDTVRESSSNAKWNLVSALEALGGLDVFQGAGTTIESLVQPKKVSILNLKGVPPDVQEMVVATTARRLFEARKLGKVAPFMLVVEEAHNFAPEKGLSGTPSGLVLRTVASEGRKFGMGLAVVSQRPAKVDKNVLSQCNTQIMLKVTNPNDLKALAASTEGFTGESEDEIQRLPVGVAFVSHPRISLPVLVEIRPRETSHGGESIDVMASIRAQEQPPRLRPLPPEAEEALDDEDAEDDAETDEEEAEDAPFAVAGRQAPPAPAPHPRARAARAPAPPPPSPVPVPYPDAPPARAPAVAQSHGRVPALPSWVSQVEEEERVVAKSDLEALSEEHLRRLHDELGAKARALARLGDAVAPLRARLDTHLTRLQDLLEARERDANSFTGRLKRIAKKVRREPARTDLRAEAMKAAKAPAPKRKPMAARAPAEKAPAKKAAAKAPAKPARKPQRRRRPDHVDLGAERAPPAAKPKKPAAPAKAAKRAAPAKKKAAKRK